MKKETRNSLLLALAALIWGVAFVAQRKGGDAIGAYSFNCLRFVIGALVLTPVIPVMDKAGFSPRKPKTKEEKKLLLKGSIGCGLLLVIASNLQQMGLTLGTPAGKAGFLTACYIMLVPIIGLFFHKKCGWNVWVGVCITLVGLYLLCIRGSLTLQFSDILIMLCAVVFSFQILCVDHYSPIVDGLRMSRLQFVTTAVITAIPMVIFDIILAPGGLAGWLTAFSNVDFWIALLYTGVLSSGVAYTLQIVGQDSVNPTIASLIMSLESVFSALAGWLFLHERMSARELLGCVLIFAAIVLTQIPVKSGAESN